MSISESGCQVTTQWVRHYCALGPWETPGLGKASISAEIVVVTDVLLWLRFLWQPSRRAYREIWVDWDQTKSVFSWGAASWQRPEMSAVLMCLYSCTAGVVRGLPGNDLAESDSKSDSATLSLDTMDSKSLHFYILLKWHYFDLVSCAWEFKGWIVWFKVIMNGWSQMGLKNGATRRCQSRCRTPELIFGRINKGFKCADFDHGSQILVHPNDLKHLFSGWGWGSFVVACCVVLVSHFLYHVCCPLACHRVELKQQRLVFSFYHLSPGDQTQVTGFVASTFDCSVISQTLKINFKILISVEVWVPSIQPPPHTHLSPFPIFYSLL